jgi:hypothetical protein
MTRVIVLIAFLTTIFSLQAISATPDKLKAQARIMSSLGSLPIYFIKNQGQLDEDVAYYVKGSDKDLYFTADGITIVLKSQEGDEVKRWAVKLEFIDANRAVKPEGQEQQRAVFSYFKGKPEDWQTGIPTYSKLVYEDIWPGIDLVYSGTVNKLKYSFMVEPGADPDQIRLAYQGVTDVLVNEQGELVVTTPCGEFKDAKPCAYQDIDGERHDVAMEYSLEDVDSLSRRSFSFQVDPYNKNEPLILDPAVILYCGYIGGLGAEWWGAIDVDEYGNVYITGSTTSDENTFPVKAGPYLNFNGEEDCFVAKLNTSGTFFEYCGYIGGLNNDSGLGIKIDNCHNVYVLGMTSSSESEAFPVKEGPDITYNGGTYDSFVVKIDNTGTDIIFCGYIGGDKSECDLGGDIDIDDMGNMYITGITYSDENSFPVVGNLDKTFNGYFDCFVAKIISTGKYLQYCGYIGGILEDASSSIVVDDNYNVYLGGMTFSDQSTFPVKKGPDLTFNGIEDAFIAKIDNSGNNLIFCGYIGGSDLDVCSGIDVDQFSNIYITGKTKSDELTFPCKRGPDLTFNGVSDVFLAKIISTGDIIEYCGYLGGDKWEYTTDIFVDSESNVYLTGTTRSDENSFPVKVGPELTYDGDGDAIIAKIDSNIDIIFCGYIGGMDNDYGKSISIDKLGNCYIYGQTYSDESTFPVQIGPDLTHNSVHLMWPDAFITKVIQAGLYADKYTLTEGGDTINFDLGSGFDNAYRNYLILGAMNATNPGMPLPGGSECLPFQMDPFTNIIFSLLNTPVFSNFMGTLDSAGQSTAQINAPPLPPGYVDTWLYFAYVLNNPFDFVSNPVAIRIVE